LTNKSSSSDVLLTSQYGIKDCLDANRYTVDCRKVIEGVIAQGKVPIVEGGSWFYIKHLFTGVADYYSDKETL